LVIAPVARRGDAGLGQLVRKPADLGYHVQVMPTARRRGSRRIAVGSHGGDAVAERPGNVSAEIGLLKIPFITGQTIQVNGGAQYY
jgi:hypothetical protein